MPGPSKPTARKSGKKSAKKSSKKSSKKPAAAARSAGASARGFLASETQFRGQTLSGRSPKGKLFEYVDAPSLAAAEMMAGAPDPSLAFDRPRPATSRYPIPHEQFLELKGRVEQSKAKPAKPGTTLARDKGRKDGPAMLSAGAMLMAGAPVATGPTAAAPVMLTSFPGIPATGWLPPDCTLAAGPSHVLLSVNATVSVCNKAGGAPLKTVTLANWFANVITNAKVFDPKALYDQHAGRWVILAVALGPGSTDSFFLLSVSKTADPLGGWFNYKLNAKLNGTTPTSNWADYPGLGVDNQALYVTANMFAFGGGFQYAKLRIIPKAGPYSGGALAFTDFVRLRNADGSFVFTLQPCHTYGAPGAQFLVNSIYPSGSGTQNKLSLWRLTNPTAGPTLTRFTITTDPYSFPPDAVQKGGGIPLDTGDTRVLNAVFRGGSVWCALTTAHNWGGGNAAACHWFQLNASTGALVQQGVFGANGFHYSYPAVSPDSNGNMVMVFSRSGSTEFASIRFTGRKSTDPAGTLQGSALLQAGVANYTGLDSFGRNRWGDYAGFGNDPADTLRTWFYSMYASTNNQWATQVGATKF